MYMYMYRYRYMYMYMYMCKYITLNIYIHIHITYRYTRTEDEMGGSNENLIVCTHTGQIMIYRDTQLIWAASVPTLPPVAVRVAQYGSLPGLITVLDDTGK